MLYDFARAPRTRFFRTVARLLIFLMIMQNVPLDTFHSSEAQAAGAILWVEALGDCRGETPCYASLQKAVDAAGAGQTVRVLPGDYPARLRIRKKNATATAAEGDRITIEADPASPIGAVVLRGRPDHCQRGAALDVSRSSFITVRGFTFAAAGWRGIRLRGGSRYRGVRLERNRLLRGSPTGCMGGIEVGRGNSDTVIASNLLYDLDRHALRIRDGGHAIVVGNTIVGNGWNGIHLARRLDVRIWNNLIAFNGTARGARSGGKYGIRRQRFIKPRATDLELENNLICGNTAGELHGSILDAGDAGNLTPTGSEGPGVVASPECGVVAAVFRGLAGPDGRLNTADDDFTLAPGSPALGRGLDPRLQGTSVPNAVFEADYFQTGARPGDDRFNIGAVEDGGPIRLTPTPTPVAPATPSPTLKPVVITPSPTPTRTLTPAATPTPTATPGTPTVVATQTPGGQNRGPLAHDDAYEVEVGTTLPVSAPGVLANDQDPDGDAMTAALVDPPLLGTLNAFNPDGSFEYQAPANFVQPGLNPVVAARYAAGISHFGGVADFNKDGFPDLLYLEFGGIRALDGRNGTRLLDFNPTDTTEVDITRCNANTFSSTVAIGDVDDSGDVSIVSSLLCVGDTGVDRFVGINGSQINGSGKVHASWVTPPLTKPHPDAYVNNQATAPADPPIRPNYGASFATEPTLARLDAGGGVKLLARTMVASFDANYLTKNTQGQFEVRYAACRAVTGLPADEGRTCRVTWIINAANGAVEDVLTAPNPSGERDTFTWRPLRENPPLVADLDGDGQVEIISGSDVFTHASGTWTLAWQTQFEPVSTAVADLDGDGTSEVIQDQHRFANGKTDSDTGIFIYSHDGTLIRRIPVLPGDAAQGFLSVGDADGDGQPDILYIADGILYVFRADGRLLWLFVIPDRPEPLGALVPAPYSLQSRSGETAPQVYDLDLDGKPEVILNAAARLFIFDGRTGAELYSIDHEGGPYGKKTLALADVDDDGHVDIVTMTSNRWNCSVITGGPVDCKGSFLVVSGQDHNWAPGPKTFNQINFRPDATDDAAKILFAPTARRDFRRAEQEGTVVDPRLRAGTTFTYTAHDATATSSPATVFLKIRPDNSPPVITSLPPTGLLSAPPYTRPIYQLTATDPDPGDVVQYELVSTTHFLGGKTETTVGGGTGVSVNPNTGAVSFYTGPCGSFGGGCNLGDVIVVVAAVDALGLRTEQSFIVTISVNTATVPDVVGQTQATAFTNIQNAGLRSRIVGEIFDSAPAGTVIAQTPVGGTTGVANGTSVDLTLSKGPVPTATPTPTPSFTPDPNATATPVPNIDSIVVEPVGQILIPGQTQQCTATAVFEDGTAADVTAQVTWDSSVGGTATVVAGGLATAVAAGTTTISATFAGKTGGATLTVLAKVPSDFIDPTAEITSPSAGSEVTEPVDVIGTATDDNFLKYELTIAPAGETEFTIIRSSETEISGGVLGTLDPTLLINDQYTLRLVVFDRNGNQASASVTIQVSRDMKVGHFTLAFEDISVPAAGLPVAAVRAYDSREKRSGDFGVGWRLDLQTIRIRTNRVLGTGWVRLVSGAFVQLQPTDGHKVSVTLPNGRVEEFDLQISPTGQLGSLDATKVIGFAKRPGTLGKLEALTNPNLLVVSAGAEEQLVDDNTLEAYEPQIYRYTDLDGTQVEVDLKLGVQKLTDPNGNQLVIGPTGITHSAGKSIAFERDAENRIVKATDPMGHAQLYAYDERGDLASHTDALGNVTTFAYDRRHNLIRIMDPLGRPVARNEYDDAGRLIAVTDAEGNRITLSHDIAGRQEVVTDRLGRAKVVTYDDRGSVLTTTNSLGETTSSTYDTHGNPLTVTDPLGHTTTYTYDGNNKPTSVKDPLGHTSTVTYDTQGRALTTTDANGHVATLTYDANGNQTSTTYPGGGSQIMTYDTAGNALTGTDPRGAVVTQGYDPAGFASTMTDALGRVIDFGRDANGNLTSQADDTGYVQTIGYDAANRPTAVNVGGAPRSVVYDLAGQVKEITTATGSVATLGYDAVGQVTSLSDPGAGAAITQTHDAEGNVTATTDQLGNVTQYEYDAANRLIRTEYPNGATELRTYDAAGRLTTVTNARGHVTTFGYDLAGRLTTITDALGRITTRAYDAVGNLIAVTDPLLHTTTYAYDAGNRLVGTTFPDGSVEERTYDLIGNLATVTDAAGHTTTFSYDHRQRLTSVLDPLGNLTRYEYDDVTRTATRIDANGNRTTLTSDSSGRPLETVYPGGDTETTIYDTAGRPTSRINGNSETVGYRYDAAGLLTTATLPGGVEETYGYTPDRIIATVVDARGTTTFEYDPKTRLPVRVTEPDGRYVRHDYDALGNCTLMAHAAGAGEPEDVTTYTYDALERLATVTDPEGGITSYDYDPAGKLTTTTLPNGVTIVDDYDVQNRVTAVEHRDSSAAVLARFTYTLDALGNRTVVTREDGSRVEYDYDATSRVTAERHYDATNALIRDAGYDYDPAGNVTARTGSLGSASFAYDARNQLTAGGGVTYDYDGAGNLVTRTAGAAITTYDYDARGRMTQLTPASGVPTDYEYDHLGLRQRKSGPDGTIDFLLDRTSPTGFAQVVRESDETGATLRTYSHGARLLASFAGGVSSYHQADGLGSTRLLTNAAGATTDTFDYAAYGSVVARTGTLATPYQFAGEQHDAESGLTYLRARYYDPAIGRFLARDPAPGNETVPLSLNTYLYANANPVNLTDPGGRETLVSLNVSQSISAQQRRTEVLNFVRNTRQVAKRGGVIYQYLGAIFSTIAAVEMFRDRLPLKVFFGNIGLASDLTAATLFPLIESRLALLSVSMFAQNAQYEIETVVYEGAVAALAPNEYAKALRLKKPVAGSAGIILLGARLFTNPPLPTSTASLFGGYDQVSGMGVMVHEWSHLILKTNDRGGYLCSKARGLLAYKQATNADNYRCLVEAYAVLAAKDVVSAFLGP